MPGPVLPSVPTFTWQPTLLGSLRLVQIAGTPVSLPEIVIPQATPNNYRLAFINQIALAYYYGTDFGSQLTNYALTGVDFRIVVLNNRNYLSFGQNPPGPNPGAHIDPDDYRIDLGSPRAVEENLWGPDFTIYFNGEGINSAGGSFTSLVGFILAHEATTPKNHHHRDIHAQGTSVDWQDVLADPAEGAGINFLWNTGQAVNVDGFIVSPAGKTYAQFAREVAEIRVASYKAHALKVLKNPGTSSIIGGSTPTDADLRQLWWYEFAGGLGGTIGSSLGSYLAKGDRAKGVLYSSLLGEVGERLASSLSLGGDAATFVRSATAGGLQAFGSEVAIRAGQAAIGAVGSWLTLELGEALGIEGFGAELFNTVGGTVTSRVIGNLLNSALGPNKIWNGFVMESAANPAGAAMPLNAAIAGAVGAFLGARLGAMVVQPQTQAAALLSSLGSAAGAYISYQAIGSWAVSKLGSILGNALAPGIGAFVGFVLGALIGNLFGRKKPKTPTANASTFLNFTSDQFELGSSYAANGGNLDLVVTMATAARDTLNGFLSIMKGDYPADTGRGYGSYWDGQIVYTYAITPTVNFGHTGGQLWFSSNWPATQQTNVASAELAVERGVLLALSQTLVIGGDILAKRALSNYSGTDMTVLLGNLQVAADYRFYRDNAELINGYITSAYASLTETEQSYYEQQKTLIDKIHLGGLAGLTPSETTAYTTNQTLIDKILTALEAQSEANPWIVTLQRAAELGLDRFSASDFNGGLLGFLMSFRFGATGSAFEDVSLTQSGVALRLALPIGAPEEFFSLLPQASADGRSVDITDFFTPAYAGGANALGYRINPTSNTSGDDFIDRSASTSGVTITDFQSVLVSPGYWYRTSAPYSDPTPPIPTQPYPSSQHYAYPGWAWVDSPQYNTQTGGDDIFLGGSGNDVLQGYGGWDWLSGGAGADTLQGGDDNDVLIGGDGSDLLHGDNGDDYLAGGAGNDTLQGSVGNDLLSGGDGGDGLYGGDGDDTLLVDQSDGVYDTLDGGGGLDALSFERWTTGVTFALGGGSVNGDGYTGVENVIGGSGADTLTGDGQNNRLFGAGESDTLSGGGGDDILAGGSGADVLIGGDGIDTASYEGSTRGVYVDLAGALAHGGEAAGDTFTSIENLRGSSLRDQLRGDAGTNSIEAGDGDDWIGATKGSDTYAGGDGLDTVDYSEGFETGTATYQQWVEDGAWEYDYWLQEYVWVSYGGHYETITSTVPGLTISSTTATWRATDGTTGTHALSGFEHVVGTAGGDNIFMGASAEFLTGGKGADALFGGGGADTYYFAPGDGFDTISDSETDENTVSFTSDVGFNSLSFSYAGGAAGFLDIYYGPGDTVRVGGNFYVSTNNRVKVIDMAGAGQLDVSKIHHVVGGGTSAANTINGLANYYDLIAGYAGDDTISGSGGSWEDKGNVIIGGAGNDIIVTSAGDDQFAFERGSGRDTVTDAGGEDTIVFGPNVAADDVIYKVVGNDLYVGIAEDANPTHEAHQVANYVRVVNGAIRYQNISTGAQSYAGVEFINAGGSWIDLRKLSIDWVTSYTSGWPPIVLDLQGDGLDLVGVDQSKIVSKLDSGFLARTSWVGPTDGFLAVDRDGDGQINRSSEISFLGDKAGAKTDLEGLQAWDTNGDGKISALDDGWSKLKLWVDVNQNGRSTTGELKTLDEAGILEINLTGTLTGSTFENSGGDSFVHNTLSFTWASGETGSAYDVELGRKLIGGEGLSLEELRAAWGDGASDAELGRLITEYRLQQDGPVGPWRSTKTRPDPKNQFLSFDHSREVGDEDPGHGWRTVAEERADFSDHDNLFAEDLARQLERARQAPQSTEVDPSVRAALGLLTDGIARPGVFGRPFREEEADLGAAESARGDHPALHSGQSVTGLHARTSDRAYSGLERGRSQMESLALGDAADHPAFGEGEAADPWAAAPITLAGGPARSRWWAEAVSEDVPDSGVRSAQSTIGIGQVSAERISLAEADPATLSAHQRLTQAMAAFGPRSGGGTAVWKRSGELADIGDTAVDARSARWNFQPSARMSA